MRLENKYFSFHQITLADYKPPTDNLVIVVSTVWSLLSEYKSLKLYKNLNIEVYILRKTLAEFMQ
jgi:hypothetical protein